MRSSLTFFLALIATSCSYAIPSDVLEISQLDQEFSSHTNNKIQEVKTGTGFSWISIRRDPHEDVSLNAILLSQKAYSEWYESQCDENQVFVCQTNIFWSQLKKQRSAQLKKLPTFHNGIDLMHLYEAHGKSYYVWPEKIPGQDFRGQVMTFENIENDLLVRYQFVLSKNYEQQTDDPKMAEEIFETFRWTK